MYLNFILHLKNEKNINSAQSDEINVISIYCIS